LLVHTRRPRAAIKALEEAIFIGADPEAARVEAQRIVALTFARRGFIVEAATVAAGIHEDDPVARGEKFAVFLEIARAAKRQIVAQPAGNAALAEHET